MQPWPKDVAETNIEEKKEMSLLNLDGERFNGSEHGAVV